MACTMFGGRCSNWHGTADIDGSEVESPCWACNDSQQIMLASVAVQQIVAPDHFFPLYPREHNDEIMIVPKEFRSIFYECDDSNQKFPKMEFAGMANENSDDIANDNGSELLILDCGATSTLTNSMFNMTDLEERYVTIELASDSATLQASHYGTKTYYAYDSTGTVRPIRTKAYYVKGLRKDLLGGKALIKQHYRVILDEDPEIAGVYPKTNGEIDLSDGFHFSGPDGLFYLQTVPISASKYDKIAGWNRWHKRMGHVPNQTIK